MFVPDLELVWHESYRVLRVGGTVMTGFVNPDEFVFDYVALYVEHETYPALYAQLLYGSGREDGIKRLEQRCLTQYHALEKSIVPFFTILT